MQKTIKIYLELEFCHNFIFGKFFPFVQILHTLESKILH